MKKLIEALKKTHEKDISVLQELQDGIDAGGTLMYDDCGITIVSIMNGIVDKIDEKSVGILEELRIGKYSIRPKENFKEDSKKDPKEGTKEEIKEESKEGGTSSIALCKCCKEFVGVNKILCSDCFYTLDEINQGVILTAYKLIKKLNKPENKA